MCARLTLWRQDADLATDPKTARSKSCPHVLFITVLFALAGCASMDEDRWRVFNDDGIALFAKGQYREALDSFDYARTLNVNDPVIVYNQAQCYDRLGDVKNAEQL